MKRVLLTGYNGFIGHHCLEYFINNTDWEIICIGSFRENRNHQKVLELVKNSRIKVYKYDLSKMFDENIKNLIFEKQIDSFGNTTEKPIDYIINLASESGVEQSIVDPGYCLKNNCDLQINILEFARECKNLELFVQMSTDEVYGESLERNGHKEWSTILPSNPYAASKAAQEAMSISYWQTYNIPIVIINAMNIIGERQNPDKFIPKTIQKISLNQQVPIYSENNKIGSRIYLHATNLADAIVFISKLDHVKNNTPDRYNVCGELELDNLELAKMIAKIMNKELDYMLVSSRSARSGYNRRYAIDGSKIRSLGWNPPLSFEESLKRIVEFNSDVQSKEIQ